MADARLAPDPYSSPPCDEIIRHGAVVKRRSWTALAQESICSETAAQLTIVSLSLLGELSKIDILLTCTLVHFELRVEETWREGLGLRKKNTR